MNATDESTDYLKLPINWVPSRRFAHGQPNQYRLVLNADEIAILELVPGKGWALSLVHGPTLPPTERGLFATLYDAQMVLYAEYYPASITTP